MKLLKYLSLCTLSTLVFVNLSFAQQEWRNMRFKTPIGVTENSESVRAVIPLQSASGIVGSIADMSKYSEALNSLNLQYQESPEPSVQTMSVSAVDTSDSLNSFQAIAKIFNNNENDIINFVMTQIETDYYYGIRKSTEMTLHEKRGNDYEKCLLAYEILQAAGKGNYYYLMKCWVRMPIGEISGQKYCVENLLGASNINPSTVYGLLQAVDMCAYGDIKAINGMSYVSIKRVMLFKRVIGGVDKIVDPYMFKKTFVNGSGINVSADELLTAAGATISTNYASKLKDGVIKDKLRGIAASLDTSDGKTIESVIGKFEYEYFDEISNLILMPLTDKYNLTKAELLQKHGNVLMEKNITVLNENGQQTEMLGGLLYKTPPEADYAFLRFYSENTKTISTFDSLELLPPVLKLADLNGKSVWFGFTRKTDTSRNLNLYVGSENRWISGIAFASTVRVKTEIAYPFDPLSSAEGYDVKAFSMKDILKSHLQTINLIAYVPSPSKYAVDKARSDIARFTRTAKQDGYLDSSGNILLDTRITFKGEKSYSEDDINNLLSWRNTVPTWTQGTAQFTGDVVDVFQKAYGTPPMIKNRTKEREILAKYINQGSGYTTVTDSHLSIMIKEALGLAPYNLASWQTQYAIGSGKYLSMMKEIRNYWCTEFDTDYQALVMPSMDILEPHKKVTAAALNLMALEWMRQSFSAAKIIAKTNSCDSFYMVRLGRASQEHNGVGVGFFVDMPVNHYYAISSESNDDDIDTSFQTNGFYMSALEHSVIEQLQDGKESISTVNVFKYANLKSILLGCASLANRGSLSTLFTTGYTTAERTAFKALWEKKDAAGNIVLDQTGVLMAPQKRNVQPDSWDWEGGGYMYLSDEVFSMTISGGYAGGYAGNYGELSYGIFEGNYGLNPNSLKDNPSSVMGDTLGLYPSVLVPDTSVADPVDLYSGAYYYDVNDIAIGDRIKFTRHYNSNNSLSNDSGLGYGWDHNYNAYLAQYSDAESAWNMSKLEDAKFLLTSFYATRALIKKFRSERSTYSNGKKANVLGTASFVAGIGIDSIYNNYMSLKIGKEGMMFKKSYKNTGTPQTPIYTDCYESPLGTNITLVKEGTNYVVSEPYGDKMTFSYSEGKKRWYLKSIRDLWDKGLTFTYNTDDRLTKVADTNSKALSFTYLGDDKKGYVISKVYNSNSTAIAVNYTYDTVTVTQKNTDNYGTKVYRFLTASKDVMGNTWTYVYDADSFKMTQKLNPLSEIIITNFYNADGAIYKQYYAGDSNKVTQFNYTGRKNQEIDPYGKISSYYYDDRGIKTAFEDQLGRKTLYEYDEYLRPTKTVLPNGDELRSTYDKWHNLISEDLYEKSGDAFIWRSGTVNVYEDSTQAGTDVPRLISTTKRNAENSMQGRTTTIEGYLVHSSQKTNLPLKITDEKGVITLNTYDTVYPRLTQQSVGGRITSFASFVDSNSNRPRTITPPSGLIETRTYNTTNGDMLTSVQSGVTSTYVYDNARRPTKLTVSATGMTSLITETTYDQADNVSNVKDPDGITKENIWDSCGKMLSETIRGGTFVQTTEYVYDNAMRLIEVKPFTGINEQYTLDVAGQVKTLTVAGRKTSYVYDLLGRQIKVTSPQGIATETTYNSFGKASEKDGRGNTITYNYNVYGELEKLTNREGGEFIMNTDLANKKTTLTSPMGKVSTKNFAANTWDLSSVESPSGNLRTFSYDASKGLLTGFTDDLSSIAYTYNPGTGTLATVTDGSTTISYTYDNMHNILSSTSRGKTVNYTYTSTGKIRTITYPSNSGVAKIVTYSYDSLGRLSTIQDWAGRVTRYTYDFAGRMVLLTRPNGTKRQLTYNTSTGELISIEELYPDGRIISSTFFGYDLDGRIINKERAPKGASVFRPEITADYNLDNQISSFRLDSSPIPVSYDVDGNMTYGPTSEKATGTYAYDVRNRLESVSSSDGSFARFNYDVENERTYQKYITPTESKEIKYVYSRVGEVRDLLVREVIVGNSTKTTCYIYGLGLVYEINEDGTSEDPERYYHYDQIGSTVALTDSTGSVTDRYSYNVFGKAVHYAGKSDTPFMYVGAYGIQTDPNGLINMRARYYNTVTMSFISSDPSGFEGGLNWYLYANGSPLMYIDENGEFANFIIGGLSSVVMGKVISALTGSSYSAKDAAVDFATGAAGVGVINKAYKLYRVAKLRKVAQAKGLTKVKDASKANNSIETWKGADGSLDKLKIKFNPSIEKNVGKESLKPRFEFRVGEGKYWDPFTGNVGGSANIEITHAPLSLSLLDSILTGIGIGAASSTVKASSCP